MEQLGIVSEMCSTHVPLMVGTCSYIVERYCAGLRYGSRKQHGLSSSRANSTVQSI